MSDNRVETGDGCLDEALQGGLPQGSMTLVAGGPGTGKTLLSGGFLYRGASRGENCLYVSLGEGRRGFLEYMARAGRDLTAGEARNRLEVMDLVTVKEEGLDTLVEMITGHLEDAQARRLVIDSFTAMSDSFRETIDARVTLHILSKILAQTRCTTLLVTETPTGSERIGLGVEEFVADGVILLRRRILDGRVFRELEIVKMRGTLVERPLHAFTLHGGFRVLPRFRSQPVDGTTRYTPRPDHDGRYHAGSPGLDEATGGFGRGDTVFIELGPNVAPAVPELILGPLRASFITGGRGVLYLPPSGESVKRVTGLDRQYGVTTEEQRRLLRIATTQPGEETPVSLGLDPGDMRMSQRTWRDEASRLHRETGRPVLEIVYADRVGETWPEAQSTGFLDAESMHTRGTGGLLVLVSRPGDAAVRHAANLAHTRLRVRNQGGVVLLDGVEPETPLYALQQDNTEGHPSLGFTPIA